MFAASDSTFHHLFKLFSNQRIVIYNIKIVKIIVYFPVGIQIKQSIVILFLINFI